MSDAQLNVRVPVEIRKRIKQEVARHRTTHEIVITSMVEDFFKSWTSDERGRFYKKQPPPYSRGGAA